MASIEIRVLRPGEENILSNVDPDVFDDPVIPQSAARCLAQPGHHLVVALDGDLVVGFASGMHYFHPDKPSPELFVNEVGVASSHHRQGIGKRILAALFAEAKEAGCKQAWVLTEHDNEAAQGLYKAAGADSERESPVLFAFPLDGQR